MKTLTDAMTGELPGIDPAPVRPGRKPKGARAMTDAERAKSYRDRKNAVCATPSTATRFLPSSLSQPLPFPQSRLAEGDSLGLDDAQS